MGWENPNSFTDGDGMQRCVRREDQVCSRLLETE